MTHPIAALVPGLELRPDPRHEGVWSARLAPDLGVTVRQGASYTQISLTGCGWGADVERSYLSPGHSPRAAALWLRHRALEAIESGQRSIDALGGLLDRLPEQDPPAA